MQTKPCSKEVMDVVKINTASFDLCFHAAVSDITNDSLLKKALKYATVGGKRIRPFVILELARIIDVDISQAIIAATAIEMIHSYSLVHDDLPAMDDSNLRRGRLTVHKKYDEATAILVGDALQSAAFSYIADSAHLSSEIKLAWISRLAFVSGGKGMILGQMHDLISERQQNLDIHFLRNIQRLKTGAIFSFCCLSVADLHHNASKFYPILNKIADNVGELFQLSDDIIGITVPANISGKTTENNIYHKKANLVSVIGINHARKLAESLAIKINKLLDKLSHLNEKKNTYSISNLSQLVNWLPYRQY